MPKSYYIICILGSPLLPHFLFLLNLSILVTFPPLINCISNLFYTFPWFSPCLYNRRDIKHISSLQFSPVAQSCLTLCDPMNHSTPGLPVHHQLPEFTQTHVHRVSDAIQPSHPLSSPSPPAPTPSQHQRLFQ